MDLWIYNLLALLGGSIGYGWTYWITGDMPLEAMSYPQPLSVPTPDHSGGSEKK